LTYTPVKKEGATGYQIDGYALNTEQGDLYLAISDFRQEDELQTLNQQQIDSYFGRAERLYKQALKPEFINALEETGPVFEASYQIYAKNINVKRVRVIIFSNAKLVARKKVSSQRIWTAKIHLQHHGLPQIRRHCQFNGGIGTD